MPVSTATRPTAKAMLPIQSMLALMRTPLSWSRK